MDCPKCGAANPDDAVRCECGEYLYPFAAECPACVHYERHAEHGVCGVHHQIISRPEKKNPCKGEDYKLEPTEKGGRLLKDYGYESNKSNRHGSLIHEYWKHRIGEYYQKKGFKVFYEKSLNGKTVDIYIKNGDKKTALEIETCKSNPVENIEKCLKHGFDSIISIPTTKDCEEKIKNELKSKGLDQNNKIKVIHVFNFRLD